MRKIYLTFLCVILIGCRTSPQPEPRVSPPLIKKKATPADIAAWPGPEDVEKMTDVIENIRKQRGATNGLPPLPPTAQPRSRAIKSLSVEPDKWIVIRWDIDPDPSISPVIRWHPVGIDLPQEVIIGQNKVNLVSFFKQQQVAPGWYTVEVLTINPLYVHSEPVSALTLFWKP